MTSSLRTYLNDIHDEITVIEKEVDPKTQVGDLVSQCKTTVLFENVRGYPGWKICDLLMRDRKAQARALKTTPDRLLEELAVKYAKGKGRVNLVKTGPVKEKILAGKDVDLGAIPFCIHSPRDAAPYIGSGMCVVKDPETGVQNVAMHRMHIKDHEHTAFHLSSAHNSIIYQKYRKMKKNMPMAVVIGHHPCWEIAACYSGDHEGYSEHEMAGSLLGEPVNLVRCETADLEVPAEAEIVLEGEVPFDVFEDEGPFGEGMLYYSTPAKRPILKVKTLTMRSDAIFRQLNATPFTDHQRLAALSFEVSIFSRLKKRFVIHDVNSSPWNPLGVIIQMTAHTEQQVRDALLGALFMPPGYLKTAIAVDEDIDIYDAEDIFHAISTRANPSTDVLVIDNTCGFPMDPSTKPAYPDTLFKVGSKIAVDATKAPLMKPEERKRFDRIRPKGWGNSLLEDFIK